MIRLLPIALLVLLSTFLMQRASSCSSILLNASSQATTSPDKRATVFARTMVSR